MKEIKKVDWERIMKIIELESDLGVKFPRSYRQFLLEQAINREKEEKKEKGIFLYFQPGREGGFQKIAYYEKRVVGLCALPDCRICNLKERERLKDFEKGELRVELELRQSKDKTREFYLGHLISVPEEEIKLPVLGLLIKKVIFC